MGGAKRDLEERLERGFGSTDKALCLSHIVDDYLRDDVAKDATTGKCIVCRRIDDDLVVLEDLLRRMLPVIRQDYEPANDPRWADVDTWDLMDDYFSDVFASDADGIVLPALAPLVDQMLWTRRWNGEDENEGPLSPSAGWREFRDLVTHVSRFIFVASSNGTSMPTRGPNAAQFVKDLQRILRRQAPELVRDIPKGTPVYRGRLARSRKDANALTSASDLGASPPTSAAANRMSPAGISMFYASADPDTAIAEIAAHDAEQREIAVVGGFRTLRALRVLDLTSIDVPSIFDEGRSLDRSELAFLKAFAADITRPVRLDGREHREYAPTQVLTELLRWAPDPDVDGIALRSSQSGRTTYVFFFDHGSAIDAGSTEGETAVFSLAGSDVTRYRVSRSIVARQIP